MFINYRRLLNLRVRHDYYSDGYPDGIGLVPTPASLRKLKGGQMLVKPLPAGITVLYRADEDETTPLVRLGELKLRFAVTISNPALFQTITDLDESPSDRHNSSKRLLFQNKPENHSEDPEDPEKLHHTLIDAEDPANAERSRPGGNLLGFLDLTCGTDDGELYEDIQEYSLDFRRQESYWKYLVVNKTSRIRNRDQLTIVDKSGEDSSLYDPVEFIRQEEPSNGAGRSPGQDIITFRSKDPIPFFEVPKPSVQLMESGGSVFIEHLPNPNPSAMLKQAGQQLESEIYVYV